MALNPVQRPSEWHPPAALGIPPSLRDHVSTLSGAYVNSGRMASGVAQLNSATAMWTEMSGQRQDTMDRRIGEVAQDLGSVRRDVQADLERTHRNLAAEAEVIQQQFEVMQQQFQAMQQRFQNRLQDELGHTKTRVHEQLERCFGQVQSRLANLGADERVQVDKTLEHVRTCTSRLENDIMATEVSYMQSLSHLVVYNSWTTAWPEAVRNAQQTSQRSVPQDIVQGPPSHYLSIRNEGSSVASGQTQNALSNFLDNLERSSRAPAAPPATPALALAPASVSAPAPPALASAPVRASASASTSARTPTATTFAAPTTAPARTPARAGPPVTRPPVSTQSRQPSA